MVEIVSPASGEEIVSANAFALLRSDIIAGSLEAGSRLRMIELQARYGIGSSPLREALSRLAADRLVLQEVNRGFRVPPISLADFEDIAALRIELETQAIEASVRAGDEAWEEGIVLAHHRLRRQGRRERETDSDIVSEEWEARHRDFHNALISSCGSAWTLHFCSVLYDQFDRYRRRAGRDPIVQAVLSRQHDELLEAAISRDPGRARRILAEHILGTRDAVVARLRRLEPPVHAERPSDRS